MKMRSSTLEKDTNRDVVRCYLKEIGAIPMLTLEEEAYASVEILVLANLRLVVYAVSTFFKSRIESWNVPLLDLVQEGNIGLMKAAERFDPSIGKFSTYAMWHIRKCIDRALWDKERTIRVPEHIRLNAYSYGDEESRIELEQTEVLSFDDHVAESDSKFLEFLTAGEVPDPMENEELKVKVAEVLSTLNKEERKVIRMKYGIDNVPMKSLKKYENIERRAMTKLRCPTLSRKLRPFI